MTITDVCKNRMAKKLEIYGIFRANQAKPGQFSSIENDSSVNTAMNKCWLVLKTWTQYKTQNVSWRVN